MLRHVSEQMLAMVTDPEELQAMLTRQPGVVERSGSPADLGMDLSPATLWFGQATLPL